MILNTDDIEKGSRTFRETLLEASFDVTGEKDRERSSSQKPTEERVPLGQIAE